MHRGNIKLFFLQMVYLQHDESFSGKRFVKASTWQNTGRTQSWSRQMNWCLKKRPIMTNHSNTEFKKRLRKNSVSNWKNGSDLQSIANLIRFFRMHDNFVVMMKIAKNSLAVNLPKSLARWFISCIGKSSAVYGHIDENGPFVRKFECNLG